MMLTGKRLEESMNPNITENGGTYEIHVAEDNSSVHVRLLPNDAVGADGYRARAYSPDLGRFMQQDPAGMVDGPNLYAYCGNEPVGRRDPSGMRVFPVHYSVWGFTSYAGIFRNYMLDCIWSSVSNEYVSYGAIASAVLCIWLTVSTSGIGYAIAAKICAKGLGTATVAAIVNCADQFQSVEHQSIIVWHTFVWYETPTGYEGWVPT